MRRTTLALLAFLLSVAPSLIQGGSPAWAKGKKPTTTSSATTTTTTWPPLPAFDTTLTWTDCGDGFQCATLNVPVDWSKRPPESRWGWR